MTTDRRDAAEPARAGGVARETETSTVDYPTETCRSCPAKVIWAVTERDKPMPVDAEPAAGGNLALETNHNGRVMSRVVPAHLAFGRSDLRLSHFATCPQADQWRRR